MSKARRTKKRLKKMPTIDPMEFIIGREDPTVRHHKGGGFHGPGKKAKNRADRRKDRREAREEG